MLIQHLTKVALVSIAVAGSGVAFAQSSVQCTKGTNGQLQAALVWRNTLGVERADALCRTAAPVQVVVQQQGIVGYQQPSPQSSTPVQAAAQYRPQYASASAQQPAPPSTLVVMDDAEYVPLHSASMVQSASADFVPMYHR